MSYVIGPGCSTCHYCYNECPVHAIGFVGTQYAIDPKKCIDCGICAKVCPSGIITNPDEQNEAPKHDVITKECDAVILGGGGAGLIAAVHLAQLSGKKVIVLEKAKKPGGNTNLGHNFMLRYSKLHEAAGYPDPREEFIESVYQGSGGKLSRPLLARATYAISEAFDWLYDSTDLPNYIELKTTDTLPGDMEWIGEAYVDFPNRSFDNLKSTDHSMGPGWMGTFIIRQMLEKCKELGVEVLTEHQAARLLVDEKGEFTAVLARDSGGVTRVNAKCCLIASGGFARNREVLEKILPSFYEGQPVHTFSVAANTGDAIGMVQEVGGDIDFKNVKIPMMGPVHHPYHFGVVRLSGGPELINVNMNGKRFRNEGPSPHSLVGPLESQPGKVCYAIGDAAIIEKLGQQLIEGAGNDPAMKHCMSSWREQLEEECTYDKAAKKADTIEELAVAIGIEPEVLKEEIKQYNSFCSRGLDSDFGKDSSFLMPITKPPYYALYLIRFNEGAEGGIVNNDHLQVVRPDGTAFTGLYTAGDCCRGLLKRDDKGGKFGEMAWAVASGYMAAEEMADFLSR